MYSASRSGSDSGLKKVAARANPNAAVPATVAKTNTKNAPNPSVGHGPQYWRVVGESIADQERSPRRKSSLFDRDGRSARGLTRDDFTVLEDGKPQTMVTASFVDLERE